MPRIPDEFLQSSVYMYASADDASEGRRAGGSGFLVGVESSDRGRGFFGYAVTNAHLIHLGFTVARCVNRGGEVKIKPYREEDWICHEQHDVAVAGLGEGIGGAMTIGAATILTERLIQEHDIGVGLETFMVGRLMAHDGGQTNQPTVRFGNISMLPSTVQMESGLRQRGWLVETRSMSGYSGSPVLVVDLWRGQRTPWLLGIDCGHLTHRRPVVDGGGKDESERRFVDENSGFAVVVPGSAILELVNDPTFAHERERREAAWKEQDRDAPGRLD
jgi:hypothetical protein